MRIRFTIIRYDAEGFLMFSKQQEKLLSASPLFDGLTPEQIRPVLYCLQAELRCAAAQQVILQPQERSSGLFIVLSGAIELVNTDANGRQSTMNILYPGDCHCENIGLLDDLSAHVQVLALDEVSMVKLDINRIFAPDSCHCPYKLVVVENLVRILSADNDFLKLKATLFSQKSLRSKLVIYLQHLARKQKTDTVYIPFNRTKLADFLAADRSALCRELGRMNTEKLIAVRGNRIRLSFGSESAIS